MSESDFSASFSEYEPNVSSEIESSDDGVRECEGNEIITGVASVQGVDDNNLSEVNNSKVRKRKRERNPENWKKNIRKRNRIQGKSYRNYRDILVPEKLFCYEQSCCSKNCFGKFNEDEQRKLFENFHSMENFNEQNAFIFSQVKVSMLSISFVILVTNSAFKVSDVQRRYASSSTSGMYKMNSRTYQLPVQGRETKLCKKLFLKVLRITNGRLDRVLKNKINCTPPKDQRGRHIPANKTPTTKVDEVCSFIQTFPQYESHYTRNTNARKYLAPDINIKIMYNEYKNKHAEAVSEPIFRKIFCTK